MSVTRPVATVLAFDFGTRRIGVAVGNTLTGSARPLVTVAEERSDARFAAIGALIKEWGPDLLVVGLPVHADGAEHAMTARAQRFAQQLHALFHLPVELADERWTTQIAQSMLEGSGAGGRQGRAMRDQLAAQVILEGWLLDHDTAAT